MDDEVTLHALTNELKAVCGSDWEWGRKESEFSLSLENHYPILVRCQNCVNKIKERNLDGDKSTEG